MVDDFFEKFMFSLIFLLGCFILYVLSMFGVELKNNHVCYDAGYLKVVVTYDYDVYCQSLTESVHISEVINESNK
jgi:hypothetical protein